MADVNDESGFSQLDKLNIRERLLVRGQTFPTEASLFFISIQDRDDFFNADPTVLITNIPIAVNISGVMNWFFWSGANNPETYDPLLFIGASINSTPGTLFLGTDGTQISSAAKSFNFTTAYGETALPVGTFFTDNGSVDLIGFEFTKVNVTPVNTVSGNELQAPQELLFPATAPFFTYVDEYIVRPAQAGRLRVRAFAGNSTSSPIVIDLRIDITSDQIGSEVVIQLPNGLLGAPGDEQLVSFEDLNLFGGVQTAGLFTGQNKVFFSTTIAILESIKYLDRRDMDDYVFLNSRYTTNTAKTGGIIVNTLPTTTIDTYSNSEFVPGVDAVSNPTLTTDGTGTFNTSDLIIFPALITSPDANDGKLFEVQSHVGNLLTVRGVGVSSKIEDFTADQFVNQIGSGQITKVTIDVLRADATGQWETASGSVTPLTFVDFTITAGGPLNAVQFNNPLGMFDGDANFTFDGAKVKLSGTDDADKFVIEDNTGVDDFTVDTASGQVGVGVQGGANANEKLHVSVTGTSTYTIAPARGILITDITEPRIVFENAGEGADDKIITLQYSSENLKVFSSNDVGDTVDVDNILVLNRDGNVGIGTSSPQSGLHGVVTNGELLWTDTEADATQKTGRWGVTHFTNAEQPFFGIIHIAGASTNTINIGGGTAFGNAATQVQFTTAANNTTTLGTVRMTLNSAGFLGINETSPQDLLHITKNDTGLSADPNSSLILEDSNGLNLMAFLGGANTFSGIAFGGPAAASDGAVLYDNTLRELLWRTNGNVTRMVLDSAGNLGIGTVSPNSRLHVLTGGTSGYTGANRGPIYTDSLGPRNVYEDTSQALDGKVIMQRWEGGIFTFDTINDVGDTFILQNMISIVAATGRVGIGKVASAATLDITGSSDTGARFISTGVGALGGIVIDHPLKSSTNYEVAGSLKWQTLTQVDATNFGYRIRNAQTNNPVIIINGDTDNVGIDEEPLTKLHVGGAISVGRAVFSATATTTALGESQIYACTDTTADRTLTISTADITDGRTFVVKDESGALVSNGTTITIDTEGAETIDGAVSADITADYGVIRLYSDGSNLFSM